MHLGLAFLFISQFNPENTKEICTVLLSVSFKLKAPDSKVDGLHLFGSNLYLLEILAYVKSHFLICFLKIGSYF